MLSTSRTAAIAAEVDRIVCRRYAVQLKTLHNIVTAADALDIESWAAEHPTQIIPLASHVINVLDSWPYVPELAISLATARTVRDGFLEYGSDLLEQTIQTAIDGYDDEAIRLAVVLLQHDLDSPLALPASVQTLLVQVFERAAQHPVVSMILPLYRLLSGAARPVLEVLPPARIAEFERHVFKILGEANDSQTPSLSLYCLNILGVLCGRVRRTDNNSSATRAIVNGSTASSFFTGAKAYKTLHLLALRVIWACKADENHASEAMTCVTLATHIVAGIDEEIKRDWATKNPALVSKLHERASRPELSPEMAFQISTFLGLLCEPGQIHESVAIRYHKLLLTDQRPALGDSDFEAAIHLSFDQLALTFTVEQWQDLLSAALCCGRSRPASNLARLRLSAVIDRAAKIIDSLPALQQAVVQMLSGSVLASHLHKLCSEAPETFDPDTRRSHGLLGQSTCSLLLSGLAYVGQAIGSRLVPDIVPDLLQTHAAMSRLLHESRNSPRVCHGQVSTRHLRTTQSVKIKGTDWRERISSVVQDQADQQKQNMANVFSELCRDLEERCTSIEAPLRAEQQRVAELTASNEEYRQAYSHIEARMLDQDICVASLRKDNERLNGSLSSTGAERDALLQRIEEAEQQLRQAQTSARDEIGKLRNRLSNAEMTAATRSACAQEAIDTSREETRDLKQRMQELEVQLGQSRQAASSKDEDVVRLQERLASLTTTADKVQHELQELTATHQNTLAEGELLHEQHVVQDARITSLQQDLQRAVQDAEEADVTHRQKLHRLQTEFEERLGDERQQWTSRLSVQVQVSEQRQAETAQETADLVSQITSLETHLSRSRKKIDRLTSDCTKKDAQILEAQEMRNRLMNAMGLARASASANAVFGPASASPKPSTLPIRSASSAETSTPEKGLAPAPAPERRGVEEDLSLRQETYSDTDAEERHRSPKRIRPRRAAAFKVPAMVGRAGLRRPLGIVSVNTAVSPRLERDEKNGGIGRTESLESASIEVGRRRQERQSLHPSQDQDQVQGREADGFLSTASGDAMAEWSFDGDGITGTPAVGSQAGQQSLAQPAGIGGGSAGLSAERPSTGEVVNSILVEMGGLDEELISTVAA